MLADGLTKGGIEGWLSHNISNNSRFEVRHEALLHTKKSLVGSATSSAEKPEDQ